MDKPRFTETDLNNMTKAEIVKKFLELQNMHEKLKKSLKTEPISKTDIMVKKFQSQKTKKKKKKLIDFVKCNYRYIALKVAYLGWEYNGLQENGDLADTIEGVLKEALRQVRLVGPDLPVRFTKCGRTDKGVSAFTQVLSTLVRTKHTSGPHLTPWKDCMQNNEIHSSDEQVEAMVCEPNTQKNDRISEDFQSCEDQEFEYVSMLNQVLPPEIRVLGWISVDESFSARWQCAQRIYHYYFPIGKLNVAKMAEAAKLLCGSHDFRNFCKINVANCKVFVRRIDNISFKMSHEPSANKMYSICCAVISASGFLYHQVRQMMTVLFLVGMGREDSSLISQLLDIESCPGRPVYDLSPAYPLVLFDASYDQLKWRLQRMSAARILLHYQTMWSELALKAHMVKELIEMLGEDEETELTGKIEGFMGIENATSLTVKDLHNEICGQSVAHGVNFQFLKQACSLHHKVYKKVIDRQKCKSFEEHLKTFEQKRKLNTIDEINSSKIRCLD